MILRILVFSALEFYILEKSDLKSFPLTRADFAGFMLGLSALGLQVILVRRLMAVFSGNELTIALTLGAWLIWTGLGSLLFGRLSDRLADRGLAPASALSLIFILVAFFFFISLLAMLRMKRALGVGPGELTPLPVILALALAVTAPVASLLGAGFNLAARMQADYRTAAGRAYRAEALGAFAAGAVLALWFSRTAEVFTAPLYLIGLSMLAAVVLSRKTERAYPGPADAVKVLLIMVLVVFCTMAPGRPLQRMYEREYWGGQTPLASFDSRYGYLAAQREQDQVTIFADGVPAATFPEVSSAEVLVHLSLAMCESPLRVLVIGGGFTNLAREILQHPVEHLDYLQLDPAFLELEKKYAPGFPALAGDPRAAIHLGDGRAWLRGHPADYDAVILNLPEPFTAGLNRFYTAEFFALVKKSLRPGGVVALFAGVTPPNRAYTAGQLGLLAGVSKTVRSIFPKAVILPLASNLIVAGDEKARLTADPVALDRVLGSRGIKTFYASRNMIASDLVPALLDDLDRKIAAAPARVDHDLHPRGYLYGLLLWAERASPAAERIIRGAAALPAWSLAALPILVLITGALGIKRGGAGAAAGLAAGVSGLVSIATELAALIAFQMLVGAVYFALTFLTAAFMVGLAAGAYVQERWKTRLGLFRTMIGLTAWCAASMVFIWTMAALAPGGLTVMVAFAAFLFGLGAVTGAVFSAAAAGAISSAEEVGRGAGTVYGAEILGSALGALLTGSLLVPVFGIMGAMATAGFTALAVLVSLLL